MWNHGWTLTAVLGPVLFTTSLMAGEPAAHSEPPKGYILVDEEVWLRLADEPARHLERARDFFLARNDWKASIEIRKAEAHLRASASDAPLVTRMSLLHAARELENLARRVAAGRVKSPGELDVAFAQAQHSLARYYYVKATLCWEERRLERAGLYLHAATDSLEHSTQHTGDKLKSGVRVVVDDTRLIAGKLVEGSGFVVDEVSKGFEHFGKGVEAVGKEFEPAETIHAKP